ncbi:MAG: carboxypeptidase regulatory-like domain-containing protein [Flavobacteriales bacterium]|nr:carboxypeptidase regulatory-like domain-containing protein [Flavobacteriales bacterium]
MNRLKHILFALGFILTANAFGQTAGEIHGKVFSKKGELLATALVEALNGTTKYGTVAEPDGRYVIKPIPFGTYDLRFVSLGYDTIVITGVVVTPDRISFPETIYLKESLTGFSFTKAVEKIEYRYPLIHKDGETVTTITAKEMKHMPAAKGGSIGKIVAAISSDVKPGADGELYFRGSRSGSVVYFIDGVKYRGLAPTIPGSGIGSVSVYTGGVPAKYGDTTGGVVVIETKSYLDAWREKSDRLSGNTR